MYLTEAEILDTPLALASTCDYFKKRDGDLAEFFAKHTQRKFAVLGCGSSFSLAKSAAIQFSQPDLSRKVLEIIQRNGTPMSAVKIEFTESTLAENPQVVTDFALEMRKHGIEMGLDDFGTGYSNIATVIRIPFGTIKLDKSLVWASIDNPTSALTIRHLVHAFRDLGMTVIAEGVETESQRQLVEDIGVEQIQGYYYSKPLSMEEMEEFLKINRDGSAGGGE